MYQQRESEIFSLSHCHTILADHPSWLALSGGYSNVQAIDVPPTNGLNENNDSSSSAATASSSAAASSPFSSGHIPPRPQGRKRARNSERADSDQLGELKGLLREWIDGQKKARSEAEESRKISSSERQKAFMDWKCLTLDPASITDDRARSYFLRRREAAFARLDAEHEEEQRELLNRSQQQEVATEEATDDNQEDSN